MKRLVISILLVTLISASFPSKAFATEPFLGEIRTFGFNFCPRGWAEADGTILDIASYSALFSLFGTMYGGDGRTSFGLPDLRGRVAIHEGTGPGLSTYTQGQRGGAETVVLNTTQIPSHNHPHSVIIKTGRGVTTNGQNAYIGEAGIFRTNGSNRSLANTNTGFTGGTREHENRMPYVVLKNCVALVGIFPSRS